MNILQRRHERIPLHGAVILCDCQALLRALCGQNLTGVSESMIRLDKLRESGVALTAQWIPSHVGIPGNEIADTRANHGRSKAQPLVPASLAHCSQVVRQRLADAWKASIERNDDNDRVVKLIEARSADESHSRGSAVQLFRLRVGHALLRENMAKRLWVSSSKCRLCDADSESISHVLFRCPTLDWAREIDWGGTSLEAALWGNKRITQQTVCQYVFAHRITVRQQGLPPAKSQSKQAQIGSRFTGRPLGVLPRAERVLFRSLSLYLSISLSLFPHFFSISAILSPSVCLPLTLSLSVAFFLLLPPLSLTYSPSLADILMFIGPNSLRLCVLIMTLE